ncbi:MAG: hypothetical protein E7376_02975 [Clostridiales bacterium]|nr:hypothetical protein [Clostridiales bacterium]
MSNGRKILFTSLALLLYVGLMVGMGFIWNLFWTVDQATTIIYWVAKGIITLMVVIFAISMLFKGDKGVGAMQLFFSIFLSLFPLILRAICMIPVAGVYIAGILGFIVIVLYLITMVSLGAYSKGEGNVKI